MVAQLSSTHKDRIARELKEVGLTRFGKMKFAVRYLPNIIHEDEHIGGIVYGRYRTGPGLLSLIEGMLIATDKRVVFLDHKPGYTNIDEVTYDVVSGVEMSSVAFMYAVKLHTKVKDYSIRFANAKCAKVFAAYVEGRRLKTLASQLD